MFGDDRAGTGIDAMVGEFHRLFEERRTSETLKNRRFVAFFDDHGHNQVGRISRTQGDVTVSLFAAEDAFDEYGNQRYRQTAAEEVISAEFQVQHAVDLVLVDGAWWRNVFFFEDPITDEMDERVRAAIQEPSMQSKALEILRNTVTGCQINKI